MKKLAVLLFGISALLFSIGCCGLHRGGYGAYYGGGACPGGNCGNGYPAGQNFLPPQGAGVQNPVPGQVSVPQPMMAPQYQPVAFQPYMGTPFETLPAY